MELWGRAMRAGIVAGCVALALLVGGCDPNDRVYIRDGVGTQLYTAETASSIELQNIYLEYLCRSASNDVGANVPGCLQVPANYWPIVVQAGLNDIDARCDSYLAWLDQKRREKAAILAEIGAIRFAVDALTNPNVTGVSGVGLAAIAAAFGLANDSVKNFHSLLLQVDQTTVQSIVIPNRELFRRDLVKFSSSIDNKPAAVHTLRTYLSICMPMTISANINSTVTVFKQTGMAPGSGPVLPTLGVPLTPADVVKKQDRNQNRPTDSRYGEIFDPYIPKKHTTTYFIRLQSALCVPNSEVGATTGDFPLTKALIKIYKLSEGGSGQKLSDDEATMILEQGGCKASGGQNYFEKRTYDDPTDGAAAVKELITFLRKTKPGASLSPDTSLATARPVIQAIRNAAPPNAKLLKLPSALSGQMTPDLLSLLRKS